MEATPVGPTRQSWITVDVDLNCDRQPSRDFRMHEPQLRNDEIRLHVNTRIMGANQIEPLFSSNALQPSGGSHWRPNARPRFANSIPSGDILCCLVVRQLTKTISLKSDLGFATSALCSPSDLGLSLFSLRRRGSDYLSRRMPLSDQLLLVRLLTSVGNANLPQSPPHILVHSQ
jgi:hypothetical protein